MKQISSSPLEDVNIIPQYGDERQQTPPNIYSWPDILCAQGELLPGVPTGMIHQQCGEADMDFSMQHFVRTVSTQDTFSAAPYASEPVHDSFRVWDAYRSEVFDEVRSDAQHLPSVYADIWT